MGSKVESLDSHEPTLLDAFTRISEQLAIPASQVDAQELHDFVNSEKESLKNCDADVKDAKRRVSAVKPKRKGGGAAASAADAGSSDGEGSISE